MRLQLYKPVQENKKYDPHKCPPWYWWKKKKLEAYPSTLYVTIRKINFPSKVIETFRSKTPVQGERGSASIHIEGDVKEKHESDKASLKSTSKVKSESNSALSTAWSRLPYETCKLPNVVLSKLPSSSEGCFVMQFSSSGLFLACALFLEDVYGIVIYCVSIFFSSNRQNE